MMARDKKEKSLEGENSPDRKRFGDGRAGKAAKIAALAMSSTMALGASEIIGPPPPPPLGGYVPTFTEVTSGGNPLVSVSVQSDSAPTFVDIDGDGAMDAFIGYEFIGYSGHVQHWANDGSGSFSQASYGSNPLGPVNNYGNATPVFVDIDGDGDFDAFIGSSKYYASAYHGKIEFWKNQPTGTFSKASTGANPLDSVNTVGYAAPSFVDIDGDGDFDAFIGRLNGTVEFWKNTGSPGAPAFTQQTGPANPLNLVDVGTYSKPTFVDIDNDGDKDVFIGNDGGFISHWKNIGSPSSPIFSAQTSTSNPFDGVDVGSQAAPTFADVDTDGDYDAFIGNTAGNVRYYRNDGFPVQPPGSQTTSVPGGTTQSAYQMVGIGVKPAQPTMYEVLLDLIQGNYDTSIVRIGRWNPATGGYVEFPNIADTSHPGWAGWFLFRYGAELTFSGEQTIPDSSYFGMVGYGVPMEQNWNQIGNPFNFPVSVANIIVVDGGTAKFLLEAGNTITQQIFWSFNEGKYQAASVIPPGGAGWIKKLTPGPGSVFFAASAGSPDMGAAMVKAAADTAAAVEPPPAPPGGFGSSGGGGGGGGGCFVDTAGDEEPPQD